MWRDAIGTYVIIGVAIAMNRKAKEMINPDTPDAKRLQGATSEVRNPRAVNTNAMR